MSVKQRKLTEALLRIRRYANNDLFFEHFARRAL